MLNKSRKSFVFLCFMLIMLGAFMAACSKSDEADKANKAAIVKVLDQEFTGPDEKLMELMWNPKYRTVENEKEENKELDKYLQEVYGPNFTEAGLESFIAAFGGTQYHTFAHNAGYEISFKEATIEQDENNPNLYTFTAKVDYNKNGEKEKTTNVKGNVQFSEKEEGKITSFKYSDDEGLSDTMRK